MRRLALCQPTGETTSLGHAMFQFRYGGRDAEPLDRLTWQRVPGSAAYRDPPSGPLPRLVVRFGGAVLPHGDRLPGPAAYPGGFSCRISAQPQATAYTSCTFSGSRHSFQVLPPSRVPKTWPRRATL